MEHEFPLENFVQKKHDYLFQMFRCSRKVSAGTTQKVVFHLLSNRIFRKIWVDGKQPTSPVRQLSKRLQTLHRPRVSQQTQDQNQHAVHARHGQA